MHLYSPVGDVLNIVNIDTHLHQTDNLTSRRATLGCPDTIQRTYCTVMCGVCIGNAADIDDNEDDDEEKESCSRKRKLSCGRLSCGGVQITL